MVRSLTEDELVDIDWTRAQEWRDEDAEWRQPWSDDVDDESASAGGAE